ncbi:hypothetical protein [Sphingomonas kyeonggiensis]|uniref:Uncharacterized protein n=1 Tax=Sphingomonas kyeonggiensis TaxID=1268553 RepID=A0A7W6NUF0_9SPHN|nr:hypothetical protein [Sphingomonas kyeonggiensis]MBB4096979.1 hypothetical protein [Sphingomonas kyeonggiensis]
MSASEPIGIPYDGTAPESIDPWSRLIFDTLSPWPIAQAGTWTRWDPGYLLLQIDTSGDAKIEPIFIDSADSGLTVMFGHWEDTLPHMETSSTDEDAAVAAAQVERLVEQWLGGDLRTAVYYRADGEWCGSIAIEGHDAGLQLRHAAAELRDFSPVRVELRSPARKDWEEIAIPPEWLTPSG